MNGSNARRRNEKIAPTRCFPVLCDVENAIVGIPERRSVRMVFLAKMDA